CVMAFMMMEASHLKEIDAQIQEIKQENTTNITPRITPSPIIPNLEKKIEKNAYEILLDSIYDRDFDLAECFKQSTKFISFENNTLNISSNAQGQNRDTLNKGFKLIQELFKAKFGENAKINVQKVLTIDENKLQSLTQELPNNENKNIDIQSSINMLKEGAKKFDPQEDLKEALKDCFGEPSIEN
ncbi:DNA polymerase III subunit gamma/tau, partial [Campylobacter jejuni]|nr:DNA polymerase III subunit gamma/tau [Campylobacter jejuni]